MGRYILRGPPSVPHNRNGGNNSNYDDGDRKKLCHFALAMDRFAPGFSSRRLARRPFTSTDYFALKVKFAVAGFPAATVTF